MTVPRFISAIAAALVLFAPFVAVAQSGILNSRHNLSASGPGTIKAASEGQVCVFCHTPHSVRGAMPLWNRVEPMTTYTLYTSERLISISYDSPEQPNEKSKRCLSCHDGTIAIGTVYKTGAQDHETEFAMANNVSTMPVTSSRYIGTDLSDDHPVGYLYNPGRDPELIPRSWPWKTPVKLEPDASDGRVECITCHDPHSNQFEPMLRIANTNAQLCLFCHNKTNWPFSSHSTSTQNIVPLVGPSTTVGEHACRNCHQAHGGGGKPYLLRKPEEQTCYQSGCHGTINTGVNTKDIQSEIEKLYSHPTHRVSGQHLNPDDALSLSLANRHAECTDCHNPHQADKGLHTLKSNQVSNVLAGVPGVEPAHTPIWMQPSIFTPMNPATKEYQICMKCHSLNGFGYSINGIYSISGPSGTLLTDQAMEFNPANRSSHPVMLERGADALQAAQLSPVWNSVGMQTMYCSDCHGNDEPHSSTEPAGPHGSNARGMLKGNTDKLFARFWPTRQDGRSLWTLLDVQNNSFNARNELFCIGCHPLYDVDWKNNVHKEPEHLKPDVYCVTCHVRVPHGSQRSRLIGYDTDPEPYNYNGPGNARLLISGFKKEAPFMYEKRSCSTPGAGGCHGSQAHVYEP